MAFTIILQKQGWQFACNADQTLLAAAAAASIRLPSSCRNGSCRTCLSQLLEGQVQHMIEWPSLSKEEKADGYILPCVAQPLTNLLLACPVAEQLSVIFPINNQHNK